VVGGADADILCSMSKWPRRVRTERSAAPVERTRAKRARIPAFVFLYPGFGLLHARGDPNMPSEELLVGVC
jgi:hypothetical protein